MGASSREGRPSQAKSLAESAASRSCFANSSSKPWASAQCDALRALSIEQSVLLGELSKGLFYSDPLFGQIVGVGAKLDALSAPAVEGV